MRTAGFLNYELPDLSEVKHFERSIEVFKAWPGLPAETFEFSPSPAGAIDSDISTSEFEFLEE
jgi:hypothetical protein